MKNKRNKYSNHTLMYHYFHLMQKPTTFIFNSRLKE